MDRLSESASAHESEDQLELYALDRLGDTETIRVEEHLMICEPCRKRLEDAAAFALAIRDVLKEHPESLPEPATSWFERLRERWLGLAVWKPQFALAAGAAVLIVGLAVGIYQFDQTARLTPVASLELIAMRGLLPVVPAARELNITLADVPATGTPFRFEILDHVGSPVWSGVPGKRAGDSDSQRHIQVRRNLGPGTYFGRLYDASGKLIHEYGFTVTQ